MKRRIIFKSLLLFALVGMVATVPYAMAEGNEQPISIVSMDQNSITINVETISNSDTAYYVVHSARNLSQIEKIQSDGTNQIRLQIQSGTKFKVISYNSNDNPIAVSSNVTVFTEPTQLKSTVFDGDIYIKELTQTQGYLYLDSYTLRVFGDAKINTSVYVNGGNFVVEGNLTHTNGTLVVGGGMVDVAGDYRIVGLDEKNMSTGNLKMTTADDKLNVGGDFVTDSLMSHLGYLTNGVMRLKGDFTQLCSDTSEFGSRHNFDSDDNFKIIFCGDKTQAVYFFDSKRSGFSIWEIENNSENPLDISNGFSIKTLMQDSTIPCDITLYSHLYSSGYPQIVDLNGYTLNIKGSVLCDNADVLLSGGQLIVEGDYIIRSLRNIGDGQTALRWSEGTIRMLSDDDYVLITGDFYQDSFYSHSRYLTAGTMEIQGNFTQRTSYPKTSSFSNFDASGTHRVILSGNGVQKVEFDNPKSSGFNILEIPGDDNPGHIIMFISPWRANEIVVESNTAALLNWYE